MYDSMDPGGLALHTSVKQAFCVQRSQANLSLSSHMCLMCLSTMLCINPLVFYYCTGQGDSTSIWVYVVVAVFAVTIVLVLAVVVVGVWLKRSLSTKSADLTTNCTHKAHHTCTCLRY